MERSELEARFARFRDAGDLEALAAVFDVVGPRLLAIARHLVADEATAEDLVQATFLTAIETAARFDPQRDLEAWLVGMLTNKAKEHRARERRRIDPERLAERTCDDPEEAARTREFVEALDASLAGVPSAYRQVLRIHLADGSTPDEIARELGRPGATVRVQLMRGLQHLRRLLPAGLALGGAAVVVAPRGLPAVRATVLTSAQGYVPHGAAAATAGTILGGLAMKKTITVAVVALLAVILGIALMREERPRTEGRGPELGAAAMEAPPPVADTPVLSGAQHADAQPTRAPLAAEEPYGALDVHVLWHDGQPVEDAWIAARAHDELRPQQTQIEGTTDAEGRYHVERIHEGKVDVGLAFTSARGLVSVERNKTAELVLQVPRNVDVRGRVVDRGRRPVAGACIFVGEVSRERGSMPIARSAGDGTFFLRSVDPAYSVIALAPKHAPSEPVQIGPADGSVTPGAGQDLRDVELIVEDAGARLHVTVVRPDGSRAAQEWVQFVAPKLWRVDTRRGFWALTDAQGEATLDGLPVGSIELLLSPKDAPCTRRSVELVRDAPKHVVIQLGTGATVSGTITHADGRPWAGCGAVMADLARDESGGIDRTVSATCFRFARTDANGRYSLGPLPAGKWGLQADGSDESKSQRLARETRVVEILDGQELTWDVVLEPHFIRGRVVDASGVPAVGWSVGGKPLAGSGLVRGVTTDAQGRFALLASTGAHSIYAQPPANTMGRGAELPSVMPDGPEVEIVVTGLVAAGSASSSVRGHLVDTGGKPAVNTWLSLSRQDASASVTARVSEDGAFRFGPLAAGTYSLRTMGDEHHTLLEALDVGAGAAVDVGQLILPACGTFVLHAQRSDGAPIVGQFVTLIDARGLTRTVDRTSEGAFRSRGIPAGTYRLVPTLTNAFAKESQVEIRADERTELELTCEPATFMTLQFQLPDGAPIPERFRAEVRRGNEVMRTYDGPALGREKDPKLWLYFALPKGTYTWSASAGENWVGEGTLEFTGERNQIPLELRAR